MTGFAREHLRPLLGSAGLHLLLIAVIGGMALRWTGPQPPVQLAIEGVVVDARDLPKSVRSGRALEEPRLERAPEAPPAAPVEDSKARERAAAEAAARAEAERERARELKARKEAAALERRKEEQAAAERKKQAADAARRQAEAQRQKEAEARAAQDAKARAAREADLKRRLAAEEEEGAARSGVKDEYRALLVQAIERNWIRPPSARAGLTCTLYVNQAMGGTVVDVKLGPCNGDEAVRESIVNAVYRASPLPAPSDPRAFERRLEIVFRPTE